MKQCNLQILHIDYMIIIDNENSSSLDVDKALDVIQYSQELPSTFLKMKLLKIINVVTLCLMISLQWLNGKLVGH